MATYNGERFIGEQVQSILSQLTADDELIVSDDGSTDGTIATLEAFGDHRIRILAHRRHQEAVGVRRRFRAVCENFENALTAATGDVIFLSDQDDLWLPGRREKMIDELRLSTLVMCNAVIIDSDGTELGFLTSNRLYLSKNCVVNLIHSRFLGCCIAFRKELLADCLPIPEDVIAHDLWLGVVASAVGTVKFVTKPLHYYRRYGSNVSTSSERSRNSWKFRIEYRIDVLRSCLKRLSHRRKLGVLWRKSFL